MDQDAIGPIGNARKEWSLHPGWVFAGWAVLCVCLFAFLFLTSKDDPQPVGSENAQAAGLSLIKAGTGEYCNVIGISIRGGITTYVPPWWRDDSSLTADERNIVGSEYISMLLDEAARNNDVRAIIVEVDSGGGSPVAGEEIAESIKRANKPVVGIIRGVGASAAYWAISPAKPIFASRNSDVGSIGVTASYTQKIDDNSRFVQLSIGKYKDVMNPEKTLNEDEKALIMRDVKIIHENFIQAIAENRGLPEGAVRNIADGSTVLGTQAKNLGLIDEIGGVYEAQDYLQSTIGAYPVICWY